MNYSQSERAMSHNVQTVRFAQQHYPQCAPSLPDRLLQSLAALQQNQHPCNGGAA